MCKCGKVRVGRNRCENISVNLADGYAEAEISASDVEIKNIISEEGFTAETITVIE